MPQYFDNVEDLAHENISFSYTLFGERFTLKSDAGVFSKDGLDDGSRLLLETIAKTDLGQNILDLGAGVGPIGLILAHLDPRRNVTLADVNLRALELSRENAKLNRAEAECVESDGMAALEGRTFDAVVTNPPIRAGKQVIYKMFADAAKSLKPGGALYLVIRKQQGAESCMKYLKTMYEEVEKLDKSGGFWVIKAAKPVC